MRGYLFHGNVFLMLLDFNDFNEFNCAYVQIIGFGMNRDARKPVFRDSESDTNQPVLQEKNARCLKFWI